MRILTNLRAEIRLLNRFCDSWNIMKMNNIWSEACAKDKIHRFVSSNGRDVLFWESLIWDGDFILTAQSSTTHPRRTIMKLRNFITVYTTMFSTCRERHRVWWKRGEFTSKLELETPHNVPSFLLRLPVSRARPLIRELFLPYLKSVTRFVMQCFFCWHFKHLQSRSICVYFFFLISLLGR